MHLLIRPGVHGARQNWVHNFRASAWAGAAGTKRYSARQGSVEVVVVPGRVLQGGSEAGSCVVVVGMGEESWYRGKCCGIGLRFHYMLCFIGWFGC